MSRYLKISALNNYYLRIHKIGKRVFGLRMFLLTIILSYSCKNLSQVKNDNLGHKPNLLINESSPYLLQHAYNPVDWHPWGEAALEKARKENKLLIVSIGYAACHWCHVMEHESFEDSVVAKIMNEHFVPIKVDREERPDVDDIYMAAAQLLTGRGGWPLNAFALPDGRPVWAGTYFPRDQWINILEQFVRLKNENYDRLVGSADQLTSGIRSLDNVVVNTSAMEWREEELGAMAEQFLSSLDPLHGGRMGSPKFPMPNNFEWLLKYADRKGDAGALEGVINTLEKMALGGIYDQLGGGFSRYSVDAIWKVPHFEKMLYDNGQLVSLYAQAFKKTGNPLYERVIRQTLEFIKREMTSSEGAFYSSLDADSEGEEGKFYVWTADEIDAVLNSPEQNALFRSYYSVRDSGNWEHGSNILHVNQDPIKFADSKGLEVEELYGQIDELNQRMLDAREKRVRPGLDDKILTSWNALMISGYIEAYKALGDQEYLKTATKAAHFLLSRQMTGEFRLYRNYKDGKSAINGFLDDYALTIQALLALYEVTFDKQWLATGNRLAAYAIEHFYNEDNGMFNYTSDIDPPLVARKMELSDNVIPASNSAMARALHRLGEFYYNGSFVEMSIQMMKNMAPTILSGKQPGFYSNWLQLMFDLVYPPYEVAIVGQDCKVLAKQMQEHYTSNAAFLGAEGESDLPLLKNKFVEGKTMIYVCQDKVCKLPVTEIQAALDLMNIND